MWDDVGGTGHDKWEKRLPGGRLLRTTIQRHKKDYGAGLKSEVLSKQLEVDERTFWLVIQTGNPASRPTPQEAPSTEPLDYWVVRSLERGGLNEEEIKSLTANEAKYLANTYFSLPTEMHRSEVRQHLMQVALAECRDAGA